MSEILELKSQIEELDIKLHQLQNLIIKEQIGVKNIFLHQHGRERNDGKSKPTNDAAEVNLEVERIRNNQGMQLST